MKRVILSPLNLSPNDQKFILSFSLLEHDLIYFFSIHDYSHAHKKISCFIKNNSLTGISSEVLTNSLIGLTSDLTASSYSNKLNCINFLELRLLFINYLNQTECSTENFKNTLNDIVTTFFSFIDEIDNAIDFKHLSKQVALAVYYVDSHRYKKLSRQSILQNLNLNAVYTTKLFQKELGFSINYYIQHVKLTEAKHLLLQTNMSVTEIAHKLQFYDKSAFSKAFKKKFAISPSKYRELNKIVKDH